MFAGIRLFSDKDRRPIQLALSTVEQYAFSQADTPDVESISDTELEEFRRRLMSPLHGMTAQEIIEYAQTLPNWRSTESLLDIEVEMLKPREPWKLKLVEEQIRLYKEIQEQK